MPFQSRTAPNLIRKKPKGLTLEYPARKEKPAPVELPKQRGIPMPGVGVSMMAMARKPPPPPGSPPSKSMPYKLSKLTKRSRAFKPAVTSSAVGHVAPVVLLAAPAGHDPVTCDCLVCLHHLRLHPPAPPKPDPFSALVAQSELEDDGQDDEVSCSLP